MPLQLNSLVWLQLCVCDLFYSFIQLDLLVFLPCEYRFSLVSLCSPRAALENAVLCALECESLISLVTHLSNAPAPWVSCIINQKTVFACIVIINHASTVVERKPRFRKMLMSRADCEFSIVCLDCRHK